MKLPNLTFVLLLQMFALYSCGICMSSTLVIFMQTVISSMIMSLCNLCMQTTNKGQWRILACFIRLSPEMARLEGCGWSIKLNIKLECIYLDMLLC